MSALYFATKLTNRKLSVLDKIAKIKNNNNYIQK